LKKTPVEESIVPRNTFKMLRYLSKSSEKVVFLNDTNLEILKGYKAYVQMNRQGEIHIIITGLSKDSSKGLFDNLEALDTADVVSDNE
jgi:hypothetical protein